MLTTLLQWIYLFGVSILYGYFTLRALQKAFHLDDGRLPGIPLLTLFGMFVVGLIAEILAIFIPVNTGANLIILAAAGILLLVDSQGLLDYIRRFRPKGIFPLFFPGCLFITAVIFALFRSSDTPLNYDTGLYHAQKVLWLEHFGTVTGLGNLHLRLAYNSLWFPIVSLSSLPFLPTHSFHAAGSFLYLLAVLLFLRRFNHLLADGPKLSFVISAGLIVVGRRLFSRELSSPGTDLPTTLLFWVILLLWMEKWEREESWRFDSTAVILINLCFFAVTVKLTAVPLLILPAVLVIRASGAGKMRIVWSVTGMAGVIFLPWLVRSVALSGYLLYPFPQLDIFSFDWKIPPGQVMTRLIGDRSWARSPGEVGQEILHLPLREWIPNWFRQQADFDQQLLVAVLASILWFILTYWITRKDVDLRGRTTFSFWLPYLICALALVYWIYSAPYVRFGYPALGILLVLCVSPGATWILRRIPAGVGVPIIAVLFLAVHVTSAYWQNPGYMRKRWLFPATYPQTRFEEREVRGQIIRLPKKGDQCWATPIPCTPRLDDNLVPRGESLGDGYRTKVEQ